MLALKGNQGTLHADVEEFFAEQVARGFTNAHVSRHETVEKNHGRIETRYWISSLKADGERQGAAIRAYCGIENFHHCHHWVMDVVFRDDECRIRKANAPANFAVVKHITANSLRQAGGKKSLRVKRRPAAWDDDFLASLITG